MHLPLSSNGFRENIDLAVMVLEKIACVLKARCSGSLVPLQQGGRTRCSGMLQGDWDLCSSSQQGEAGRSFTPFPLEQNVVIPDKKVQ